MISHSKANGLSARRKTVGNQKKIISHVVLFCVTLIMLMTLTACDKENRAQSSADVKKQNQTVRDSVDKPQVNIKVNRRYDDKGNMIGFDSTYSSYYSNVKGDTTEMDTLMKSFDRYFDFNHTTFFNNEFKPLFFNDSLRYPDFFHHDYFIKRYELNDRYMRDMMHRMDSIKNKFYFDRSQHEKYRNNRG
jgi:hypothetical protein